MCEICFERFGIEEILLKNKLPDIPVLLPFYLAESTIDQSYLKVCEDKIAAAAFNSKNTDIIFYRIIETLTIYGFDSSEYKELIDLDFIGKIVFHKCKKQVNLNEILPLSRIFLMLFNIDTYFVERKWDEFINSPDLGKECIKVILLYSFEKLKSDILLDKLYRVIFFSIVFIGRNVINSSCLFEVIINYPIYNRTWGLWFQRRSAEIIYREFGCQLFLDNIVNLHPGILIFLVVKYRWNVEDRYRMYDVILNFKHDNRYLDYKPIIDEICRSDRKV
jgi:hypothetical protein